jgi:YNFM family putative membrane transporter
MYATQPLQPLLANEFDVSIVSASYFTAIIMFFLAIAPIVYGYIIEHISSKKLLQIALIVLFITNIFLTFSTNFEFFSFTRTIEAILIPALLTTSMAILASDKQNIKQNMSIYVAATVFGGLFGRVVSGFVADIFGWRAVFIMLSISMLIGIYLLQKLEFEGETNLIKAKVNDIVKIIKQRQFLLIYILMFTMFYTFGGLLNLLPFYMKDIIPSINETQIGLLYLGYGVGIVVALKINTIISWFKKPITTLMIGLLIFISSTSLFIFENYY